MRKSKSDRILKKRDAYQGKMGEMDPNKLVFIDEAGAHLNMTLPYARAQGGNRIHMSAPANRGAHISMIGAISTQSVEGALYGEWSTNGDIFYQFCESQLIGMLKPGYTVIMDNIGFHKAKRVKALIEATGAKLEFLPEYSPDLNPIEPMWSKIKNLIKQCEPRTLSEFKKVIKNAFYSITIENLTAWFTHCGYTTN